MSGITFLRHSSLARRRTRRSSRAARRTARRQDIGAGPERRCVGRLIPQTRDVSAVYSQLRGKELLTKRFKPRLKKRKAEHEKTCLRQNSHNVLRQCWLHEGRRSTINTTMVSHNFCKPMSTNEFLYKYNSAQFNMPTNQI